jgi:hypothetical protein
MTRKLCGAEKPIKTSTFMNAQGSCGASCRSSTQAAAHCVGPAVRERERLRQLAALQCSPEELKRRYPKWKYHPIKGGVIVEDPQAEFALGAEWVDKPFPEPQK